MVRAKCRYSKHRAFGTHITHNYIIARPHSGLGAHSRPLLRPNLDEPAPLLIPERELSAQDSTNITHPKRTRNPARLRPHLQQPIHVKRLTVPHKRTGDHLPVLAEVDGHLHIALTRMLICPRYHCLHAHTSTLRSIYTLIIERLFDLASSKSRTLCLTNGTPQA